MLSRASSTNRAPRSKRPPSAANVTFAISARGEFYNARFVQSHQNYGAAHTAVHLTTHTEDHFPRFEANSLSFNLSTPGNIETEPLAASTSRDESPSELSSTSEPPPAKRPCTATTRRKRGAPRLKITRPVQAHVVEDVWRLVFCRAEPAFLIEQQSTSRLFRDLLREDPVWQQARINHYGHDMPETPFEGDRKEQKYAILLAGKGCQNRSCPRVRTNKVFWVFRLRLCEECFRQRTIRGDVISAQGPTEIRTHNLLDLLPAGVAVSGKYRRSREYAEETDNWIEPAEKVLFFLSDVDEIVAECQQVVRGGGDITAWRSGKLNVARKLMRKTLAIENWEKSNRGNGENFRERRQKFFEQRAAELSPPLLPEALNHMVAFHKALDSRRSESEQCWNVLKEKLLTCREDAERIANLERLAKSFEPNKMPETESLLALYAYRSGRCHNLKFRNDEQTYVAAIAQEELKACMEENVADEDLVLSCLHRVFERHRENETRPEGMNVDGKRGKYNLSLDDARIIVEEVVTPQLGEASKRRADDVLGGFRCKGCSRSDCTKKYDFKSAFHHIYAKHAKLVGDDYYFDYFAKPLPNFGPDTNIRFPWLIIPWPRNLPLAAGYDETQRKTIWKPDDLSEFSAKEKEGDVSAFVGRKALVKNGFSGLEFGKNMVYAASKLKETRLSSLVQTKIALRYALDLHSPLSTEIPTLNTFTEMAKEISAANPSIDFRFRCGACVKRKTDITGQQFIKHAVGFHTLLDHWKTKHAAQDWTLDMMDLPSDCLVWDQIEESDKVLGQEKEATLLREERMKKMAKKKPNAKAKVILAKRYGAVVLNELFPLPKSSERL